MRRRPINLTTAEGRQRFYQTKEWRTLRAIKLVHNPLCERCNEVAEEVHHVIDIKDDTAKALSINNLESLCKSCHSTHTNRKMVQEGTFRKDYETVNLKWKDIIGKLKGEL